MPGGEISVVYKITDTPAWYLSIAFGLQQFLTMMGGNIATPLIVSQAICIGPDVGARAELMSTMLFVNGIATLIQLTIGCRLPIIQGASFTFIIPIMAMQNVEEFKCPEPSDYFSPPLHNGTLIPGSVQHRAIWTSRLCLIQGSLMIAGAVECLIGIFGFAGMIIKFVGPLAIAPTTALIGITLVESAVNDYASKHWAMSLTTIALIVLFSLILDKVEIPSCSFKKCSTSRFKIFGLFPVLLGVLGGWALSAFLTAINSFPESPSKQYGYEARTDIGITETLAASPWFRVPYPGEWGMPSASLAMVLGTIAAMLASAVESVGNYYACARLSAAPPPPLHAINRGIAAEGIGCIISGAFGSGPGVTSYSENIGTIGITKVASRRVIYFAALILILVGCVTKIAAVLVSIPLPVIGGVFIVSLSMVAAVGFSNLQFVDMSSSRNLLIFGLSIFFGVAMPMWTKGQGHLLLKTGSLLIDQVLIVLLSTGMFVGGLIGLILDNLVPASREERGIDKLKLSFLIDDDSSIEMMTSRAVYDLPFVSNFIRSKLHWAVFIPVSPTFEEKKLQCGCRWVKKLEQVEVAVENVAFDFEKEEKTKNYHAPIAIAEETV